MIHKRIQELLLENREQLFIDAENVAILQDEAALSKEFADSKRIYPEFFMMGAVVLLPFLFILFVLKRSAK